MVEGLQDNNIWVNFFLVASVVHLFHGRGERGSNWVAFFQYQHSQEQIPTLHGLLELRKPFSYSGGGEVLNALGNGQWSCPHKVGDCWQEADGYVDLPFNPP